MHTVNPKVATAPPALRNGAPPTAPAEVATIDLPAGSVETVMVNGEPHTEMIERTAVPTKVTVQYGTAAPPDGYEILSTDPLHLIGAVDGQEMRLQERDGQYWFICRERGLCGPVPLETLFRILRKYTRNPDTASALQAAEDICRRTGVIA